MGYEIEYCETPQKPKDTRYGRYFLTTHCDTTPSSETWYHEWHFKLLDQDVIRWKHELASNQLIEIDNNKWHIAFDAISKMNKLIETDAEKSEIKQIYEKALKQISIPVYKVSWLWYIYVNAIDLSSKLFNSLEEAEKFIEEKKAHQIKQNNPIIKWFIEEYTFDGQVRIVKRS